MRAAARSGSSVRNENFFERGTGGLRDAARELNERCAEAKPIIERHYQYTRDTHDHKAGDQLEPHFTITAQRRARELVDMPRGEAETIEFLAARELTQEVDLDRANEQAARTGQPVRPDLNLVFDEKKEWVMR